MAIFGDYERVLGFRELTGVVRKEAPIPTLAMNEIFTNTRTVSTLSFDYDVVREPMTPASVDAVFAKATRAPRAQVGQAHSSIVGINEFDTLEAKDILFLREPGTTNEVNFRAQIGRIQQRLLKRILRRKEQMMWDILQNSYSEDRRNAKVNPIYFTPPNINVLNYNSPAVNDWESSPGNPALSPPGAPILSSYLPQINRFYRNQSYGNTASRVYLNAITAGRITTNQEVKAWWKDMGPRDSTILSGGYFPKLGQWNFNVWDQGYALTAADDAAKVITPHIPNDRLIILPEGNIPGCTYCEGPNIIPRGVIGAEAGALFDEVPSGIISYATITQPPEPFAVNIFVSLHFGAYVEFPESIMLMTLR